MRTTAIVALAAAAGAAAQSVSPMSIVEAGLTLLSSQCQATVETLVNSSSPLYSCLQVPALLPAILTNGSIVPYVDAYLSSVCAAAPCDTSTLNTTAAMIVSGCATDLARFNVDNETVYDVIGLYPLAREIACLKTTNATAPSNASIPINSTAYNNTNGTFCVTEVMTDLSGWLGANLTNSYLDTVALGGNTTAIQILETIPKTALCSDCVFAAIDLVQAEYPGLGSYNVSMNYTVDGLLNATCPAYNATSNGTIPSTVLESAGNSSFPFNVTSGNATYTPNSGAASAPTFNVSNAAAIVSAAETASASPTPTPGRRWLGRE